MRKKKEQEDSLTLEQTKEQVNWILMVYIHVFYKNSSFSLWILYISFFYVSRSKFAKMGKFVIFYICGDHFLSFKEFLLANNTGYDFCLLNILRFRSDREKGNNKLNTEITRHAVTILIVVVCWWHNTSIKIEFCWIKSDVEHIFLVIE